MSQQFESSRKARFGRRFIGVAALGIALAASTALSPVAAGELSWTDFAPFAALENDGALPPEFYAFLMSAFVGPQLAENGSTMLIPTLSEDLDLSYHVWDGDTRVPLMLDGSTPSYDITLGSVRLSRDGSMLIGTVTVDGKEKGFVIPDGMNGAPAIWLFGVEETVVSDVNEERIIGSTLELAVQWNLDGDVTSLSQGSWSKGIASIFSGDGNVIFGRLYAEEAFDLARWGGPDRLFQLETLNFSGWKSDAETATAIVSDLTGDAMAGTFTVGTGEEAVISAFYWKGEDGFQEIDLDGVDGTFNDSGLTQSLFISSAGDVVVGGMLQGDNAAVFRWTEAGGAVDISARDGNYSDFASGMTADGSVIVGTSLLPDVEEESVILQAFRWNEADGYQSVYDYLTDAAISTEGWAFNTTIGISADGTVMAGLGTLGDSIMYWLSRCDEDEGCGVTTVDGVANSVASIGLAGETSNLYLDDAFDIASGAAGAGTGPTGGVYAYGAYDSDPMASAGLGLNLRLSPTAVAGVTVGRSQLSTPLAYAGEAVFDATSVIGYFAERPESGLVWEAGIAGVSLDGTVTRGYMNGSDLASSSGTTTGSSWGATLEAGWRFAEVLPATAITPYASYSYMQSSYNGWTETDGPFPATIADFATTTQLVRIGAEVEHAFAGGVVAEAGLALVHRQTDSDGIGYELTGLLDGTIAGSTGSVNWVEASAAVTLPLGDMASTQLKATGRLPDAGDASFAANATLNFAF